MASIAQEHSLFEIDRELDTLLDKVEEEIQCRGEASAEILLAFAYHQNLKRVWDHRRPGPAHPCGGVRRYVGRRRLGRGTELRGNGIEIAGFRVQRVCPGPHRRDYRLLHAEARR